MIVIASDHVKLQLISTEDLEQVRQWRNASHVNEFMEFKKEILAEEQARWYADLDKRKNLYFKILVNDQAIGIINLKDIDWREGVAEAGIFVGIREFMGGVSPMLSILILMKTAFKCFQLKALVAKISSDNINALQFNQQLGYTFQRSLESKFELYRCSKSDFYSPQSSISNLHRLLVKNAVVNIYVDENDEWILKHLHFDDSTIRLQRI